MRTKIIKVGNSNAVIIPTQTMHERGWATGDELELEALSSGLVVIESRRHRDVLGIVRRLVVENRGLLRRLADL
jgi:antitoxin component of MazEF toxin-antitoxin module